MDIHHREWPVVLITNPKHALFINPSRENIDSMKNSTHIRLVFNMKIDFYNGTFPNLNCWQVVLSTLFCEI